MVHLVYCDDKTKELNKIIEGSKTMVIRREPKEKYHIVGYFKMKYFILWKNVQKR